MTHESQPSGERPCHSGSHRGNRRERRSSPLHGKNQKSHGTNTENVPDHVYIKMLAEDRARRLSAESRRHGNVKPTNNVKTDTSRSSMATDNSKHNIVPDTGQFLFQREDLEKMRLNRDLIFNMKSSICALSKFASELDKEITDVKTKQRATTSLWKDIKAKVKAMDHILCDDGCQGPCKVKMRKPQGATEDVTKSTDAHFQKLILPKLETGSRPNSTPSILEMQETLHRGNVENVNKSKVSNIKQIARKRSQEKALRDVDMQADVNGNTSSESVQKNKKQGGKATKQTRKALAERLRQMEEFQDKYILAGKDTANSDDAKSGVYKGTGTATVNYGRSVAKQNKGKTHRKF